MSLTELCSICFTNTPKYTCPRCGCQTCGLECVKKHKKQAGCSGVRDPAAYRKRADLATSASIDQDYNFITKVQRDLERAEDGVAEKGIILSSAKEGRPPIFSKSKLDLEIEACGVTVIKAPKGLTRSKQNKSHWDNKHKCIMWTVEWVQQNERRVVTNIQGTRSVLDGFMNAVGKKGLPRKRKLGEDAPGEADEDKVEQPSINGSHDPTQKVAALEKQELNANRESQDDQNVSNARTAGPVSTPSSEIYFYLHRPKTSPKRTCLIPLVFNASISDTLRNRTVLEYPTIYAKHDAPEDLQAPFITEKDYLERYGADIPIGLPTYGHTEDTSGETELGAIDEKKVLEVLQKDLVG